MKKLKCWAIGLRLAIFGAMICIPCAGIVVNFIAMMDSTGKEFIGYFIPFIIDIVGFIILPYIFYKVLVDDSNKK